MGPIGPREDIQRAIAGTGCVLRPDPASGGMLAIDCPTFEARAELVDIFAWRDAYYDGDLHLLAREITRRCPPDAESFARTIHAEVRDRIRFVEECGDKIQESLVTWNLAAGDCDCHARLVLALLRSLKIQACLVGFLVDGAGSVGGPEVKHAAPTWERTPGDFVWMETTLPARFGEHPLDAAERLFVQREDLR